MSDWFPHDNITGAIQAWTSPRRFITSARIVEALLDGLVKPEHHSDPDIHALANRQFLALMIGGDAVMPEWHDIFGTARARPNDDD